MKRSVRMLALVTSVTLMGGIAACSSAAAEPSASASGPIKIGVALPLSGPLAPASVPYKTVIENIGKGIPNTDTIDGRKVEIVLRDSQGTAAGSSATIRQLLDQDSVDVVIGPLYTAEAEAAMPLTTQSKKLEVTLSGCPTCGDAEKYPTVFSVEADRPSQMPPTVKWMKDSGLQKVAVLVSNDGAGKGYADAFTSEAQKGGVNVVKTVSFAPNSLDLGSQVAQLKASGADAVYLASAVPVDNATATKAMRQADYQPAVFGNAALAESVVTDGMDPAWLKKWASSGSGENAAAPKAPQQSLALRDALNKIAGSKEMTRPLNQYSSAMDAFGMIKAAIEGTHTTDAAQLTAWLVKNGFKGTKADFTFTAGQHNGMTPDAQVLVQPGTMNNGFLTRVGK